MYKRNLAPACGLPIFSLLGSDMSRHSSPPGLVDRRVAMLLYNLPRTLGNSWTSKGLASSVRLSPSRLRSLFVSHIGLPPMRYLQRLRLQAAQRLLAESLLSVKEIASVVGFGDLSHFLRTFRTQCGSSPSAFRKACHAIAGPDRDFAGPWTDLHAAESRLLRMRLRRTLSESPNARRPELLPPQARGEQTQSATTRQRRRRTGAH